MRYESAWDFKTRYEIQVRFEIQVVEARQHELLCRSFEWNMEDRSRRLGGVTLIFEAKIHVAHGTTWLLLWKRHLLLSSYLSYSAQNGNQVKTNAREIALHVEVERSGSDRTGSARWWDTKAREISKHGMRSRFGLRSRLWRLASMNCRAGVLNETWKIVRGVRAVLL